MQELDQKDRLVLFKESIKSEATKRAYMFYLKRYLDFSQDLSQDADAREIESKIIDYIISMKQQNKSHFAIKNHISSILAFYKINDVVLNVSKIKRFIPSKKKSNRDRAYTHQEIHSMLDIADERMRVVLLLLTSSGMRVGAVPLLRLRNLTKVNLLNNNGQPIYKITVYENDNEEYFTFTTPECVKAIDDYLDMRSRYGEKFNPNSYLIREQFDIRDQFAIKNPRITPMAMSSITHKIRDIAIRVGLRYPEKSDNIRLAGSIRKEVAIAHGFRKFFTTQLIEADVKTELRWLLEGHNLKANDSNYVRTSDKRLQQEYEKAINALTINEENRLKMQVKILEIEKSQLEQLAADVAILKRKWKLK
jgi:site-specific recombinase XerD